MAVGHWAPEWGRFGMVGRVEAGVLSSSMRRGWRALCLALDN